MNNPLVSICIPTFNSEFFLEETINSLISQTYKNIEIIIGDNGSTDLTLNIIKQFVKKDQRIKYFINEENIGYAKNCNKLISNSTGEFIAIFHSDDIYDISMVEKQVKALTSYPDILGVFTSYFKINSDGEFLQNVHYPLISNETFIKINLDLYLRLVLKHSASCFCCPTSMIRTNVYKMLNGYDEKLKYIEDQDMWARILLNGSLGVINEKLIKYRIHENQESTIYSRREIDKYSLPLNHIFTFIKNNSLENIYEQQIYRAEASELIFFSRLAVKNKNYKLFVQKIKESKKKYRFCLTTKSGLIQNFPIPRVIYLLAKLYY